MLAERTFDFPARGFETAFEDLNRMRREMDRLFGSFGTRPRGLLGGGVFPLANLTEDDDNYYVRAELPGMTANDLDISVTRNSLSISGERKIPAEGDNVRYHRKEREEGKFSRVIGLPYEVNPDKVEAGLNNGILTITIAKAEKAKPRKITVH